MSLAETGKVGRTASSASSNCSTTSGEDEAGTGMRHRDNHRYAKQDSVDEEVTPLVSKANSQDVITYITITFNSGLRF